MECLKYLECFNKRLWNEGGKKKRKDKNDDFIPLNLCLCRAGKHFVVRSQSLHAGLRAFFKKSFIISSHFSARHGVCLGKPAFVWLAFWFAISQTRKHARREHFWRHGTNRPAFPLFSFKKKKKKNQICLTYEGFTVTMKTHVCLLTSTNTLKV